jgi:hypothetical protein
MISDLMPPPDDVAGELGIAFDGATDHEERRLDVLAVEHLEKPARVRLPRPVVERQRHHVFPRVRAAEHFTKQLPTGMLRVADRAGTYANEQSASEQRYGDARRKHSRFATCTGLVPGTCGGATPY